MKKLDTKSIQCRLLSIMKQIHNFCIENNIQYSLEGGSLIGAVRHKGFVPWDDDFDIMMTRPNFEKFCNTFCQKGLELKAPGQDGYYLKFARVFDTTKTIVKEHQIPFSSQETGIWVDVFPIDSAPIDEIECSKLIQRCKTLKHYSLAYRRSLYAKNHVRNAMNFKEALHYMKVFLKPKLRYFIKYPIYISIERIIEKERQYLVSIWNNKSTHCIGVCFAHNKYTNIYDRKWFEEYIVVPFEDTELCIIKHYDEFLSMVYGNYMIIPPKEKQVVHSFYKVFEK